MFFNEIGAVIPRRRRFPAYSNLRNTELSTCCSQSWSAPRFGIPFNRVSAHPYREANLRLLFVPSHAHDNLVVCIKKSAAVVLDFNHNSVKFSAKLKRIIWGNKPPILFPRFCHNEKICDIIRQSKSP